jgi:hypothetical protein
MNRLAALLLVLSSTLLAGCASASGLSSELPPGLPPGPCGAPGARTCGPDTLVPVFCPDGRLRRDVTTDAPVFGADRSIRVSRAPRFNADGSVCRDPETGAPLYDEVAEGRVVRVLVVTR